MTVSTTATRIAYTGNASTTAFAFSFRFLAGTDIAVYLDGVLQSTGYTVSAPGASGTVTFSTAPASGVEVVITRATAKTQETDYVANDAFSADATELAFDRAMLAAQDNAAGLGRALRVADHLPAIDPIADPDAPVLTWANYPVNVSAYGAKGDGVTDDTAAINAALTAASTTGAAVYFPAGSYSYSGGGTLADGVVCYGDGPEASIIISRTASPTTGSLFYLQGLGTGVRSLGFEAGVTQTSGCYVFVGGIGSFIENFRMSGDINGVWMTGNVARVRNGTFKDGAANAIRIKAEGGDNSQIITDVVMKAQTPSNVCTAGIRLRNCAALTISNVSILQQGVGLLIDPTSSSENVLNLFCNSCFFDGSTFGIYVNPTSTAVVARLKFTDVWVSGLTDGAYFSGSEIAGVLFKGLQANLCGGNGLYTGSGCKEIEVIGGNFSGNAYGVYCATAFDVLRIFDSKFGNTDRIGTTNSSADIRFNDFGFTNVVIDGCFFNSSTKISNYAGITSGIVTGNLGFVSESGGSSAITAAATSVTINHGLGATPTAQGITITPTNSPTTDPGHMWVSSITSTQFTVNCRTAPGASTATFEWKARLS
jgi:hypothetical protein